MRASAATAVLAPGWNARWRLGRGAPAWAWGCISASSRGALFACAAGLVTLIVAARRREQLEAITYAVAAGVIAFGLLGAWRGG